MAWLWLAVIQQQGLVTFQKIHLLMAPQFTHLLPQNCWVASQQRLGSSSWDEATPVWNFFLFLSSTKLNFVFRTSHGCAVLNLGGREVVVVAGGQVGLDDDNNVEEANDNGRDNDNDDDSERCRSVTCQSQASLAVLILIKNRLVVRCFPQWSTSAWQRTITGRPCPLSRFQGSSKQAL